MATGPPGATAASEAGEAAAQPPLHARSFKLRFASRREPGRSYVSLVKPLGLPATVTGKFYCREQPAPVDEEALRRIERMFQRGPRERLAAPVTSAQEYGWHARRAGVGAAGEAWRSDARLSAHVRDSAWLRERLRVLAADDCLKQC